MPNELLYSTRDENGSDFVKIVKIKKFPLCACSTVCPICSKNIEKGVDIKKIVSGKFTDWAYVGEYICENCSALFSLYFYSYIVSPDGIKLLNVRELKEQLCAEQKPPFRFVITTTQKKHLFYRSKINYDSKFFAVNLETETIYTKCERMQMLFDFAENMMTLGASKKAMQNGEVPFETVKKVGFEAVEFLDHELKTSREIQIPLFCGQKREVTEEEAKCCIISILKTSNVRKQL